MSTAYTEKFRNRMIARMVGPNRRSATALAKEVGVPQPTLSVWLRNAKEKDQVPKSDDGRDRPQAWTPERKLQALIETAAMSEEQLGGWLRKNGLHSSDLATWRQEATQGLSPQKAAKPARHSAEGRRIRELERALRRKEKALAETAALLVLSNKVQELWADEDDDTSDRSGK